MWAGSILTLSAGCWSLGENGDIARPPRRSDSMALGRIDYFVLRPAVSSDELFHQAITGFLLEWTEARRIAPAHNPGGSRELGRESP